MTTQFTAAETLRWLEGPYVCPRCTGATCEFCLRWQVMVEAVREKAAREDRAVPVVTLAEQEQAIQSAIDNHDKFCHCSAEDKAPKLKAALHTIRTLRVEAEKFASRSRHQDDACDCWSCLFIGSLEVCLEGSHGNGVRGR